MNIDFNNDFPVINLIRNLLQPDEYSHLFSVTVEQSSQLFKEFSSGIICFKDERYILSAAYPVKDWIHFPIPIEQDLASIPTGCFFKEVEIDIPSFENGKFLFFPLEVDSREKLHFEGWFFISSEILKDKTVRPKVFFAVDIIREAVRNIIKIEKIKELTIIDDVTGLYNTRHLYSVLKHASIQSDRYHTEFSMVFLDIDHFKNINDKNNHLIGSRLLKEIGVLMVEELRKVDLVFRYGGDEFVIYLPHTNKKNALIAVSRLRDRVRNNVFEIDGVKLKITASFGLSSYPEDGATIKEIMEKADKAMYKVKKTTRDSIETA